MGAYKIFDDIINLVNQSKLFKKHCIIQKGKISYSNFNPKTEVYLLKYIKILKDININQYFILEVPKYPIQFILYRITENIYFLANSYKINFEHIELLTKIQRILLKQFIKCVVISTASVLGPTPQIHYPPQDENFINIIAMKSLILLAGNQDERSETTSVIPIGKDTAFVHLFYISHPKGRDGIFDATITIVVNSEIRNILINSINTITRIMENYLKQSNLKVNDEGNIININKSIKSLFEIIQNELVNDLNPTKFITGKDAMYDIYDFKKSISDLRKMLGKYE
ncbi:MAG: hypothetical protein ACTSPY_10455 [Candidatus Helarchaeota archaeon]